MNIKKIIGIIFIVFWFSKFLFSYNLIIHNPDIWYVVGAFIPLFIGLGLVFYDKISMKVKK